MSSTERGYCRKPAYLDGILRDKKIETTTIS